MKENILNDEILNIEVEEEKKGKYIYDKNKMKKVSLKQLLLSQASILEMFYLVLGSLVAIFNGITTQFLEYYTGKLITYFSSDASTDLLLQHLKQILISYIIVSILSFIFGFLFMAFCSLFQK